ncbi:MAG TPA: class I SAM-dependent methyltransferase [Clostridiales bacterium]|nr:class I SAM-dependent methyltransferase [Clostridiales bacterium]
MEPYTSFASVYDMFMDNIPYDQWADYVDGLLKKYGIHGGLLLELGCGTGSMTRRLSNKGYDVIGIDSSEEMLAIARDKTEDSSILYLCQDMREFELYGTVAAVVSVCDSMNYILSEEDLIKIFRLVNNYLDPKGLFIFDLDTEYAYKDIIGDKTIAENREEGSFIWENTYYEEEKINQIDLTLFIPTEDSSSNKLFIKEEETHYRRAYSIDTIKRLIEEAGMEWVTAFHTLSEEAPRKDSERIYVIAREKHQKDKYYI